MFSPIIRLQLLTIDLPINVLIDQLIVWSIKCHEYNENANKITVGSIIYAQYDLIIYDPSSVVIVL